MTFRPPEPTPDGYECLARDRRDPDGVWRQVYRAAGADPHWRWSHEDEPVEYPQEPVDFAPLPTTEPPPPSVERALALLDELLRHGFRDDLGHPLANSMTADALRSAIRALGAGGWRGLSEAPTNTPVRLLCQRDKSRRVFDCFRRDGAWLIVGTGYHLGDSNRPLAWKPADSTELPAELEGK